MSTASKHKILQFKRAIQVSGAEQQKVDRVDFLLTAEDMDLLTKQEVADLFKMTVAGVSAWITQGRLLPTKLGSLTRISRAELERFVLAENARLRDRAFALIAEHQRLERLRERVRRVKQRHAENQDMCDVCEL